MTENVYSSLLSLKKFQEKSKEDKVRRQRDIFKQEDIMVGKRRHELKTYNLERKQKENSMYDNIMEKCIPLDQLQGVNLSITSLREEEKQYENRLTDSLSNKKKAEVDLTVAKKEHHLAIKKTQKFEELNTENDTLIKKENQHKEEMEMEEFSPSSPLL